MRSIQTINEIKQIYLDEEQLTEPQKYESTQFSFWPNVLQVILRDFYLIKGSKGRALREFEVVSRIYQWILFAVRFALFRSMSKQISQKPKKSQKNTQASVSEHSSRSCEELECRAGFMSTQNKMETMKISSQKQLHSEWIKRVKVVLLYLHHFTSAVQGVRQSITSYGQEVAFDCVTVCIRTTYTNGMLRGSHLVFQPIQKRAHMGSYIYINSCDSRCFLSHFSY
ncbi:hypothetical protein ABPG72_017364 [Tetrahymena utriculariae]